MPSRAAATLRIAAITTVLAACTSTEVTVRITPPAPVRAQPEPPVFACPVHWASIQTQHGAVCEPFPAGLVQCAGANRQSLGGAECTPVSQSTNQPWPQDAPDDALFVRSGSHGIGTRDAPLGSLQTALDLGVPNIVLADGEYAGSFTSAAHTTLWGTRASQATLRGVGQQPALRVTSGSLTLHDLHVVSSDSNAIQVDAGEMLAQRVWVEAPQGAGVSVQGGVATLHDVVFEDESPTESTSATGLVVANHAEVDAVDLTFRGLDSGMTVRGVATASEVSFRDLQGAAAVVDGGELTLTEAVVDGASGQAIQCLGGTLELSNGLIRRLESTTAASLRAFAVFANDGAQVYLSQVWIQDVPGRAIAASADSQVIGDDVVLDTGIVSEHGGFIALQRAHISVRRADSCARIHDESGSIGLTDALCERRDSTVAQDEALLQPFAGSLSIHRSRVVETGSPERWIHLLSQGDLTLTDVALQGRGTGTFLWTQPDTDITINRVDVQGAGQLFDVDFSSVVATDLTAANTQVALGTITGGTTDLERVDLSSAQGGLHIEQSELFVTDTTLQTPVGIGLRIDPASALRGQRLHIHNTTDTGLFSQGEVQLSELWVQGVADVGVYSLGASASLVLQDYRVEGFVDGVVVDGHRAELRDGFIDQARPQPDLSVSPLP